MNSPIILLPATKDKPESKIIDLGFVRRLLAELHTLGHDVPVEAIVKAITNIK